MSGYLTTPMIEATTAYLAARYPGFCTLIRLPETSVEGRAIHALRIHRGGDARGVLLLGGVHARELINPDLLASWVVKLCHAYANGDGIAFNLKAYDAGTVKFLVEGLDLFVVPLVNPDGRVFVQAPGGDRMWRKNRSANTGQPCRGVDLNRNYDFLHSSGIGTSASACSDVFRGPSAFSEPETRNVRWLLDTHPRITGLLDIHSYGDLILYPWGDDDNQTTDPSQNFTVPNPSRGIPGDTVYREYIPADDQRWYVDTGARMRGAMAQVRGRFYTVLQSIGLYPTTATIDDYAYARHSVDTAKRKVLAYTYETSAKPTGNDYLGAFQPPYAEAQKVMLDAGPGIVEFCLAVMCVAEALLNSPGARSRLVKLRVLRDRLVELPAGRELNARLQHATPTLLATLAADSRLRTRAAAALDRVAALAEREDDPVLDAGTIEELAAVGKALATRSPTLRPLVAEVLAMTERMAGQPLSRVVERWSQPKEPLEAH